MKFKINKIHSLIAPTTAMVLALFIPSWGIGSVSFRNINAADALPGQTPEQVADWIKVHPALKPQRGERLLIRKSDTAARRFQFQASVLLPGLAELPGDANTIRSEQISFFDIINGVTRSRLEEALRSIYGAEVMRDFSKAKVTYAYPTADMVKRSRVENSRPLIAALRGELRLGEKFAYWIEILHNDTGRANSGQITVFDRQNLSKLEEELRKREFTLP
ncbi:hypothetical protein [Tumidithrix elongata]|uniref:hypothetical protein n=1 Tax=Tumidithrix elongata TaxID=3088357 RepID=UPI0038CD2F37